MTGAVSGRHLTGPASGLAGGLPGFVALVRAPNPGPMTLDGTNTWVLRGPGAAGSVVVDPGPDDEEHLRAVAAAAGEVALILSTHGHPDHVGGLNRFVTLTGAPARAVDPAFCAAAPPLAGDADPLPLAGLTIRPVATPGHTADSVSFLVAADAETPEPVLLTGDTILGRGTTIVAWPDGDLTAYLASLERLAALSGRADREPGRAGSRATTAALDDPRSGAATPSGRPPCPRGPGPRHDLGSLSARPLTPIPALPGHGPALADCAAAAAHYLAHRRARLEQVQAAVAAGADSVGEVVARVYADVDRTLWPAAELTVRAQLAHLAIRFGTDTPSGDEGPHPGAGGNERPRPGEAGEENPPILRLDRP